MRSKVLEWLYCRNRDVYENIVQLQIVKEEGVSDHVGHFKTPPIGHDNKWFKDYVSILRNQDTNNPN